jgi:hypothetical protein
MIVKIGLAAVFLTILLSLAALLLGCSGGGEVGVPNMEPVGDGLTFFGVCVVVMALVFVLGLSRN